MLFFTSQTLLFRLALAITVTEEVDDSDVQEIVIIPVKEEPFNQVENIYTNKGENDNDFDSHESENDLQVERSKCYNGNDDLGNTRAVDIDFKNGSKFEGVWDEGTKIHGKTTQSKGKTDATASKHRQRSKSNHRHSKKEQRGEEQRAAVHAP